MRAVKWLTAKGFTFVLTTLLVTKSFGQDKHFTNPEIYQPVFTDFNDNKQLFNIDAVRSFTNDLRSSNGSNYFNPNWEKGIVYFKNGQTYKDGLLQFDFVKNELHFLHENKVLSFAQPVQQFTLVDTANGRGEIAIFRNGYPAFGPHSANDFYQVLSTGRNAHLLRTFAKENVNIFPYDPPEKRNYKITVDWFLYDAQSHTLQLINSNVSSIIKALPAYEAKVLEFTNGKKRKLLADGEMVELIDKINTL